jgi:hypothetical protein
MTIVKALMSGYGLRIDNGCKWLVYDTTDNLWKVYERLFGKRKTDLLIETEIQDEAVAELIK